MKRKLLVFVIAFSLIVSNFVAPSISVSASNQRDISLLVATAETTNEVEANKEQIKELNSKIKELRVQFEKDLKVLLKEFQDKTKEIKDNEKFKELSEQLKQEFVEKSAALKAVLLEKEGPLKEQLNLLQKKVDSLKKEYINDSKVDLEKVKKDIANEYSKQRQELTKEIQELNKSLKDSTLKDAATKRIAEIEDKLKDFDEEIEKRVRDKIKEVKDVEEDDETDEDEKHLDKKVKNDKANIIIRNSYKKLVHQNEKYELALKDLEAAKESADKHRIFATITKYENVYKNNKYEDQKLYSYLNAVQKELVQDPELEVPEQLETAYEAYIENRELLKDINDKVKELKIEYYKEEIKELEEKVSKLEDEDNIEDAIENYEKVYEKKSNQEAFQKLKELHKKNNNKDPKVYVNGKRPQFDVNPFIKDGRALVPIRHIADAFDAIVEWNIETKTAIITKDDTVITLVAGSKIASINSKKVEIDVPATIYSDRVFVPLRFISEAFDSNVTWDDETKLITIKENEDVDLLDDSNISNLSIDEAVEAIEQISDDSYENYIE